MNKKIKVTPIEGRGYGIMAMENIEVGERLIIERALITAPRYEDLLDKIMRRCKEDGVFRAKLLQMTQGDDQKKEPRPEPVLATDPEAVDVEVREEVVRRVLVHNLHRVEYPAIDGCWGSRGAPVGLWPTASILNHCTDSVCATTIFFRDWIQISSIHKINAGQEIFVSYVPLNMPFYERRNILTSQHGFDEPRRQPSDLPDAIIKKLVDRLVECRNIMDYEKRLPPLIELSNQCHDAGQDPSTVDIFAELATTAERCGNMNLALESYALALETATVREPYSIFSCMLASKIAYAAKMSGELPADNVEILTAVARKHHDVVIGKDEMWEVLNPNLLD